MCPNVNPLLSREWIKPDPATEHHFTVMTYNILNHEYTEGLYENVAPEHMDESRRLRLAAHEILAYSPDAVCLQEIGTHAYRVMDEELSSAGYCGIHAPKKKQDGLATFYKPDVLELVSHETHMLSYDVMKEEFTTDNQSTVVEEEAIRNRISDFHNTLVVKLRHIKKNKVINIANIHTVWEFYKKFDVQCVQMALGLHFLHRVSGGGAEPYMIVGDFNSTPSMPVYRWILEGKLTEDIKRDIREACCDGGKVVELCSYIGRYIRHQMSDLKSCYHRVMGREPSLTSAYIDDSGTYIDECLDYICIGEDRLHVVSVLETSPRELIDKASGIPNSVFPSDHLSLMAGVRLL